MPGIRSLVTIPAGLARMSFIQFVGFTFIGTYVWCTLMIGLGFAIGHEWKLISELVRRYTPWLITTILALGGLVWIAGCLIRRRLRSQFSPIVVDLER